MVAINSPTRVEFITDTNCLRLSLVSYLRRQFLISGEGAQAQSCSKMVSSSIMDWRDEYKGSY